MSQPMEDRRQTEAALWRARLTEEPHLALTPEYLDWAADPRNRRLAQQADDAWDFFAGLGATPEMIALRQEALGDARRAARRRWAPQGAARLAAAAAVLALVLSAGALTLVGPGLPHTYRTGVAERRVVMLEDGSRLSLDAATQVRVRYSRGARKLELAHGQARFDVAHDAARPFMVDVGERTVIATGTAFNIDRLGKELVVTLIEGSVVVRPQARLGAAKPPPAVPLKAGQKLVAAGAAKPAIAGADLRGVTAWERGQLMFTDEPLSEAVQKVNRYAAQPIVVDPSAEGVRVSGAFDAADTASFLDAMSAYFDLETSPDANGRMVLKLRS